ncbi:MAG TPA: hypothetical protein V6C89_05415 [Drouetiella sp.]|jgi:hypothetical protein
MNTTGQNLQQVHCAADQKSVVKDPAASSVHATTHEAIQARRGESLHPLDPCAPTMVQTFAEPPPLLKKRSAVRRSYTSLIAMSPTESLLPPTSHEEPAPRDGADDQSKAIPAQSLEAALASQMTPSKVLDEEITDKKAVADLCSVLNADEGVLMTNPDAPSIARSTLYSERRITAQDVIGAIDSLWAVDLLPSVELFSKE